MSKHERVVNEIIDICIANKQERLVLAYKYLSKIPERVKELTWLKHLNLRANNLEKISRNELPPRLETLDITRNEIKNISGLDVPKGLTTLYASYNRILKFDGKDFESLTELDLTNNHLETLVSFPKNMTICDISVNNVIMVPQVPGGILELNLSNNQIHKIDDISAELEDLNLACNCLTELPALPDTVRILNISDNDIEIIEKLPDALEDLIAYNNKIVEMCALPAGMKKFDVENNLLTTMPELPTMIEDVNMSSNKISELVDIPESVNCLNISGNSITYVPLELKIRNDLIIQADDEPPRYVIDEYSGRNLGGNYDSMLYEDNQNILYREEPYIPYNLRQTPARMNAMWNWNSMTTGRSDGLRYVRNDIHINI